MNRPRKQTAPIAAPNPSGVSVKLLAAIVGDKTENAGQIITVDPNEAARLIAIGAAVAV